MAYRIVGEFAHALGFVPRREVLERAEAQERRSQTHDDCGGLDGLAQDGQRAAGDGERAGGGDSQRRHRFAGEIFADRGAQHRPPVTEARVRRCAGALELHFVVRAAGLDFTHEDRAPVAELTGPHPELVAGIHRRDRLARGRHVVAACKCQERRAPGRARVEPEQRGGLAASRHEHGIGQAVGPPPLPERFGQPGVTVRPA